jgi:hypothetical protein
MIHAAVGPELQNNNSIQFLILTCWLNSHKSQLDSAQVYIEQKTHKDIPSIIKYITITTTIKNKERTCLLL